MGRGRPKKKVTQTPPTRVRILSPAANASEGKGTNAIVTEMPTLEPIVKEGSMGEILVEQEKSEEHPHLWVDVIKGNRLPSHGIGLEYTPPDLVDDEV